MKILVAGLAVLSLSYAANAHAEGAARRRIDVTVKEHGFEPTKIAVKKDEPLTLVFTRKVEKTCAKEVIIQISDKEQIKKVLPLNEAVSVDLAFPKAGEIKYACGMNMYRGVILVE